MTEKKEKILLTGLRLLYILELLNKKASSKKEVLDYIKEKTAINNYSNETLKLDINSLIKNGFKIKRKGVRENFKYELEEKPEFLKFNKEETEIFSFLKNAALEVLNYREIIATKNFFCLNKNLFCENSNLFDYEGFNSINQKIVENLDNFYQKNVPVKIVYSSPLNGRKEFIGVVQRIKIRSNKLYITLYDDLTGNEMSFRADKIKNLEKANYSPNYTKKEIKTYRYLITKVFFENNPILKTEKVLSVNENSVEIENLEEDEFFVIQRLLTLGKSCIKIYDNTIKEKILKILKDTLGVYEKCQIQ